MHHPRELELKDRVVAITGASRGIGRAIAEMLHEAGAKVIAGARVLPDFGSSAMICVELDVTNEESVSNFARLAAAAGADSLINNAGIGIFGPIESIDPDSYRSVFDTNVLGMLLTTKHFTPHFKQRFASGLTSHVVNITSDVSSRTFPGGAIYTASKHAQRAICQTTAREGETYGLRVTEIRPGMTDTFFNGGNPGSPERSTQLKPHDIARSVLFALASPPHARVDEITVHPTSQPVSF